jgi:hypothetical protein
LFFFHFVFFVVVRRRFAVGTVFVFLVDVVYELELDDDDDVEDEDDKVVDEDEEDSVLFSSSSSSVVEESDSSMFESSSSSSMSPSARDLDEGFFFFSASSPSRSQSSRGTGIGRFLFVPGISLEPVEESTPFFNKRGLTVCGARNGMWCSGQPKEAVSLIVDLSPRRMRRKSTRGFVNFTDEDETRRDPRFERTSLTDLITDSINVIFA